MCVENCLAINHGYFFYFKIVCCSSECRSKKLYVDSKQINSMAYPQQMKTACTAKFSFLYTKQIDKSSKTEKEISTQIAQIVCVPAETIHSKL